MEILKEIRRAIIAEIWFVVGTMMLVLAWWLKEIEIENEREYFEMLKSQHDNFNRYYDQILTEQTFLEIATTHPNAYGDSSVWRMRQAQYAIRVCRAINNFIYWRTILGQEKRDTVAIDIVVNTELRLNEAMRLLTKQNDSLALFMYDSLMNLFPVTQQGTFANVYKPYLESKERIDPHRSSMNLYNSLSIFLLGIGTVCIAFNKYQHYRRTSLVIRYG